MKQRLKESVCAAALCLMVVGAGALHAEESSVLQVGRVSGNGPITDISGPLWDGARSVKVPLQPQMVALPVNPNAATKEITVRSVHNGEWVAFLLEWQDASKSDVVVVDGFGDQVAVELPVDYKPDALPSPMMGDKGSHVNILQWRAVAQLEVDMGREVTIRDLYPNAPNADLYYTSRLPAEAAAPYRGAKGLGNPISERSGRPVLDMMAEGFSSLTVRPQQEATGRGVYRDGMWHVVITAPMVPVGDHAPRLEPGQGTAVAFAAWDGGNKEVGSRKAWSDWVTVSLAR
ncbi:MAG: ethylbenzene dehydrogenase-related protein [Magnetococcus sp. MYC-9]